MSKLPPQKIIKCPKCHSQKLHFTAHITCTSCKSEFQTSKNKIEFLQLQTDTHDTLDSIKALFKKFPKLYAFLMKVVSPVYSPNFTKKFVKDYIEGQKVTALNLGSGSTDIHPDIINADCCDYENVNIVCDINSLPFIDSSIDRILNAAVLEHVPSPACAVNEMRRVLKPNGIVCCYMPFIVGFHASPSDYSRLTSEGLRILFKDFEIISLNVCGGPTSGMLWIFQEWLAMILSFGSKKLHLILYIIIMLITWPIKFLDIFFIKHPKAANIASGFLVTARKK